MTENPIMVALYVGIAVYVGRIYWADYRAARSGAPTEGALPGATPAPVMAYLVGMVGSLAILAAETGGEIALGVAAEQSEMLWYALFAILAAGVIEEVIFRGFLVVENRGRAALLLSIIGFSLGFAVIHPQLWSLEDGFHWTFTAKGWFTTAVLFANSLWWYAVRFGPWNPERSIFPCMVAHAVSNFGVYAVKLAQGYVIF